MTDTNRNIPMFLKLACLAILGGFFAAPVYAASGTRQFVPLVQSDKLTPVSQGIATRSGSAAAVPATRRFIPLTVSTRSSGRQAMMPLNGGNGSKPMTFKPLSSVPRIDKKEIVDVSDEVKLAMAGGYAEQAKVSAALAPLLKGTEAAVSAVQEEESDMGAESADLTDEELETDLDFPEAAMIGVGDEPSDAERKTAFVWPVDGDDYTRISSAFGARRHPVTGKQDFHAGIDIPAPVGTKVLAALDGEVTGVGQHQNLGRFVKVTHADGSYSLYGHLSRTAARPGKHVKAGEVIGMVGSTGRSTGPHLDFSIRRNGRPVNPMPLLASALKEKKLALAD